MPRAFLEGGRLSATLKLAMMRGNLQAKNLHWILGLFSPTIL
jgi:hypothetical protein